MLISPSCKCKSRSSNKSRSVKCSGLSLRRRHLWIIRVCVCTQSAAVCRFLSGVKTGSDKITDEIHQRLLKFWMAAPKWALLLCSFPNNRLSYGVTKQWSFILTYYIHSTRHLVLSHYIHLQDVRIHSEKYYVVENQSLAECDLNASFLKRHAFNKIWNGAAEISSPTSARASTDVELFLIYRLLVFAHAALH